MSDYVVTAQNQNGLVLDHGLLNTDGAVNIAFNGSASVSTSVLPAGSWVAVTTAGCWIARSPRAGVATATTALPLLTEEYAGPFKTIHGDYFAVLGYAGASGNLTLVPYVTVGG